MVRVSMLAVVGAVGIGCGPSVGPPTLAEYCGQTDPIQLLALEPDEVVEGEHPLRSPRPGMVSVAPYEDRWLIGVRRYDRALGPDTVQSEDGTPTLVSSRIVSVDACGGDARVVAEGVHEIRVPTGDEPWIGCGEGWGIVAFDPAVESSGRFHPDLLCTDDVVDGAFVTVFDPEDGDRNLVRARLFADAPAEIDVLARIRGRPEPIAASPHRFLAINGQDALIEVDVRTGAVATLRDGVEEFHSNDDGRFIEWSPDARYSSGTWYLWDRETNEERSLGLDEWPEVTSYGMRPGTNVVAATFPIDGTLPGVQQLIWLPEGDTRVLDGVWDVYLRTDEHTVLSSLDGMAVLDAGSDEMRFVASDTPTETWTDGESLWGLFTYLGPTERYHTAIEMSAPDFLPRIDAIDVWFPLRTTAGGWVTVRERTTESQRHGTLVVLDPAGHAVEIDHDVIDTLGAYNGGYQRRHPPSVVDDVVVYPVRDPDHERTGVWAAGIPAG